MEYEPFTMSFFNYLKIVLMVVGGLHCERLWGGIFNSAFICIQCLNFNKEIYCYKFTFMLLFTMILLRQLMNSVGLQNKVEYAIFPPVILN